MVIVLAGGLVLQDFAGRRPHPAQAQEPVAAAHFVGSEACAGCHTKEAALWRGSQHKQAMDHATATAVLADFNDTSFDHDGVHSRFFRDGGKFRVETDGADGKLATFDVKYTFGVYPLQQYLVEFPDGRVQALPVAWDTRPKAQGGQHWFHLYPGETIAHGDILHWTRLNQNWNFMCAECHSTGVRKNYDAAKDRFATRFAEISVGCEACHGQGSRHVDWARRQQNWWPYDKSDDARKGLLVLFDERSGIAWQHDPATGNPSRSAMPPVLRKEVETCGLCHARRGTISEDWTPGDWLAATHNVALLARGLYSADGQMQDEVYNYGSFKQSRMFAAGVTCSDCHEPHGATLRLPGDNICLQCHTAGKYATEAHRHHDRLAQPLGCADCHMAVRTYMVIDQRHDHSFRVPRPDLSVKLGTPNACNDCHADKAPQWAADAVERWFGPQRKGFQTYASAFHAAWSGETQAASLLAAVAANEKAPGFARASALTALAEHVPPPRADLAKKSILDPDPMVRIGALDMLENADAAGIWPIAAPLLADPVRGVRLRAAMLLAPVPTASQPPADRAHYEAAANELIAAQRLNADRPEARTSLADFFARRGRTSEAEEEYKAALRLEPEFAPAAINLADLLSREGRDSDGETLLRATIARLPNDAGLHHALGLTLIRQKRLDSALGEFRLAATLARSESRYIYVYGVALHSAGRGDESMQVLKDGLALHPQDRDLLLALVTFNRDAGNLAAALDYAERLRQVTPDDRNLAEFIAELRHRLE